MMARVPPSATPMGSGRPSFDCTVDRKITYPALKACKWFYKSVTFLPGSSLRCDFPFGVEGEDRICVVQIQTTDGIILMGGASIRASNIYLNSSHAPIIISEGASIVADGLGHGSGIGSWANQYSAHPPRLADGAGAGGSCSNAYQMKTKGDGSHPLRPVGTSIPPGPDHEGAITNRQIDPTIGPYSTCLIASMRSATYSVRPYSLSTPSQMRVIPSSECAMEEGR